MPDTDTDTDTLVIRSKEDILKSARRNPPGKRAGHTFRTPSFADCLQFEYGFYRFITSAKIVTQYYGRNDADLRPV